MHELIKHSLVNTKPLTTASRMLPEKQNRNAFILSLHTASVQSGALTPDITASILRESLRILMLHLDVPVLTIVVTNCVKKWNDDRVVPHRATVCDMKAA